MKLWIRNILQNIINRIESEEDKTLPEDYFKNIIVKLQQLPKRKITEEKRQEIWKLYQLRRASKPGFSCELCKQISICKNCPIYCQTFSPD